MGPAGSLKGIGARKDQEVGNLRHHTCFSSESVHVSFKAQFRKPLKHDIIEICFPVNYFQSGDGLPLHHHILNAVLNVAKLNVCLP